jgi:hypothetical protein
MKGVDENKTALVVGKYRPISVLLTFGLMAPLTLGTAHRFPCEKICEELLCPCGVQIME